MQTLKCRKEKFLNLNVIAGNVITCNSLDVINLKPMAAPAITE